MVISLLPAFLHVSIANLISSYSAIPVDLMMGFSLEAGYSIKGMSVISNDAILYIGLFKLSKRSTVI
jgi:hypothetical protein